MSRDDFGTWPVGPPVDPRCLDRGHVVMVEGTWPQDCFRCNQPVSQIDVPRIVKPQRKEPEDTQ